MYHFLLLTLSVCRLIFGFEGNSNAATHYVSPTGNATWVHSTNINTPCSISTAFSNAKAGGTVYFRGGTYEAGESIYPYPVFYPKNSGILNNPITFMAYPGETPIINGNIQTKVTGYAGPGTSKQTLIDNTKDFVALGIVKWDVLRTQNTLKGGAAVSSVVDSHTVSLQGTTHNSLVNFKEGDYYEIGRDGTVVLGCGGCSYIIFDGFTIQGNNGTELASISLFKGSTPRSIRNIIRNCIIVGPSTKKIVHGDNRELIRVENQSNVLIERCKFYGLHHIKEGVGGSETRNTSGFKSYRTDNMIIQNCEISENAAGIYLKSDADNTIVRYNYIHDNKDGITIPPDTVRMNTDRVQIYHNVIANCSDLTTSRGSLVAAGPPGGSDSGTHGNDISVFNNTFYKSNISAVGFGYCQSGHGYSLYNNIIATFQNYSLLTTSMVGGSEISYLKEADHNFWVIPWRTIRISNYYNARNYGSLVTWQASNELESPLDVGCGSNRHPGCGDLAGDPLFVNASGQMNTLTDFALQTKSPAKNAGRGGVDMGANIDLVGISHK